MLHIMPAGDPRSGDDPAGASPEDLRQRISSALFERLEAIETDTATMLAHSGVESLDAGFRRQIGHQLAQLLAFAIRDGGVDPRGRFVADLRATVASRGLSTDRFFTFVYHTERVALDELAIDGALGATREVWPLVAQLMRRASFDLLAAYVDRLQLEPAAGAIVDALTTLHTRPLFDAVLAKDVERAARAGYPLSLLLLDVDHLSAINAQHGYGVGDKILERIGILMHHFFRHHDWVARHGDDSFVVLLTQTDAEDASGLAERLRTTVAGRLGFVDHLTGKPVAVSLTGAIINLTVESGAVIDIERLMADAELAVARAKREGRNRIERIDVHNRAPQARPAS